MGEYDRGNLFVFAVTPCVGVWIEITPKAQADITLDRHSLCGSVD